MNNPYLIIAIVLIAALVVIFITTFVIYRRTPVPKGCENLKIDNEHCKICDNISCPIKKEKGER